MEKERKNHSADSYDAIMALVNDDLADGWQVEYIMTEKGGTYNARLFRTVDNRHELQRFYDELVNSIKAASYEVDRIAREHDMDNAASTALVNLGSDLDDVLERVNTGRFENALGELLEENE